MLQLIRDYAKGTVAWVLMIMISVPFALWGIQSYFGTGQESPVATVGDKEIFQRDVNRVYEMNLAGNEAIAQQEQLFKTQALNGLIQEEVLKQSADKLGLVVADDSVRRFVQQLPYFQEDGTFSQDKYQQMLAAQGMTSELFIMQVRRAMRSDQFQLGVRQSSFVLANDLEHYFRLSKEKRSVEYVNLAKSEEDLELDDGQVEAYYNEHQDRFMSDALVSVDYVMLDLGKLASEEDVSGDQLTKFYEENKSRYTRPERRKVSHILLEVPDRDKVADVIAQANTLRGEILAGDKSFADVAKERSKDPGSAANGGDLGIINKGEMVPAFEETAFSLKLGEISKPVETDFGIHLVTVTELTPEVIKSFEDVKSEIEQEVKRQLAESRFFELAEQLAETAYETPDSLQPSADLLDAEIQHSEMFSSVEGAGIAANIAVRNAAFSPETVAGNNSEPIEIGADQVVVLRQNQRKPSEPKSLEEVSEQIQTELLESKRQEMLKARADKILKDLQAGTAIEQIASQESLELVSKKDLGRDENELPFELRKVVFKGQKTDESDKPLTFSARLSDGTFAIGVVSEVMAGEFSDISDDEKNAAEKQLAAAKGRTEFEAYTDYLMSQADISYKR